MMPNYPKNSQAEMYPPKSVVITDTELNSITINLDLFLLTFDKPNVRKLVREILVKGDIYYFRDEEDKLYCAVIKPA